jgi:glycerol-3-phosphate dehydrogenase subunit B
VLHQRAEWRIGDVDLATLHDDAERLAWLGARLREALGSQHASGLLLGPWLGSAEPRAEALSTHLGLPVGEALVGVGSPAGFRFAAARARFIEALGLRVLEARVTGIAWDKDRWQVGLEDGGAPHAADAVVLANGGLIGGGVLYRPAEHMGARDLPPQAVVPFHLNLEAEVPMGLRGQWLGPTSSLHGPALDEDAWPRGPRAGALEAAGVLCDGVVVRNEALGRDRPLYAAGDVIADRPRTVLQAIASGLLAGARAGGGR